jgi:hypothetical protein
MTLTRIADMSALLICSVLPGVMSLAAASCGITTDGDFDGVGGGYGQSNAMQSSTEESVSSQSSESATTEVATTDAQTSSASTTAAATTGYGLGGAGG